VSNSITSYLLTVSIIYNAIILNIGRRYLFSFWDAHRRISEAFSWGCRTTVSVEDSGTHSRHVSYTFAIEARVCSIQL